MSTVSTTSLPGRDELEARPRRITPTVSRTWALIGAAAGLFGIVGIQASSQIDAVYAEEYAGDASRLWTEAADGRDLLKRVMALPGFGRQKAQIFVALLAKQLGVRPEGWEVVVGDYALEGHRSVADVVDGASLQKVRDFKKQKKAAARAQA